MPRCEIHKLNYQGIVCPQCAMASRGRMQARQQQQVVQQASQTVTVLPQGAALALEARVVGQQTFEAVNTGAPLYIPLGTQVEFKAVATGAGVPVNFGAAAWSGTAGAGGTGASKTITFNAASATKLTTRTVIVSFSGKTVTAACVVYTLTPVTTPVDNFAGHSANDLGVDERVTLGFTTTPAAITAAEAGDLKWSVSTSGRRADGTVQRSADLNNAPAADGTGFYIAPYVTGAQTPPPATKAVSLKLLVTTGPIKGAGVTKAFTVHLPVAHMKKAVNSEKHIQNYASAGFQGEIYLFPKTVSYQTLRWREAGGRPTHSGPFSTQAWADNTHKPTTFEGQAGEDMAVAGGDQNTGCQIQQIDSVYSGRITYVVPVPANDATVVGTYTWPIYWQYRPADIGGDEPYIRFQIAYHVATMYESGRMVMYKGHDPANNCVECTARANKNYTAATATPF